MYIGPPITTASYPAGDAPCAISTASAVCPAACSSFAMACAISAVDPFLDAYATRMRAMVFTQNGEYKPGDIKKVGGSKGGESD